MRDCTIAGCIALEMGLDTSRFISSSHRRLCQLCDDFGGQYKSYEGSVRRWDFSDGSSMILGSKRWETGLIVAKTTR